MINNKAQGVYTWNYDNGNIKSTINMVDGKAEGMFKSYDSNGKIKIEQIYSNDCQVYFDNFNGTNQ